MTAGVVVHPDPVAGGRSVAERLRHLATEAVAVRGRFVLGLSGGESPEPMLRALAQRPAPRDWSVFWCDERLVPTEDDRSNFALARTLWLRPAGFPSEQTFPVPTGLRLEEAVFRYEATLRGELGSGSPRSDGPVTFDALVLGVGPDGHTASLFPGAASLEVGDRWVVGEPKPARPPLVPRVTLTLAAIRSARYVLFLAWGAGKRAVLRSIRSDPGRGGPKAVLPAARVGAREAVEWHVDRAAAP